MQNSSHSKPEYVSLNQSIASNAVVVFLGRRLYLTPSQTIPTLLRLSTQRTPGEAAPLYKCHRRCSYSAGMAVVMVELLEYSFRLFVLHLDRRHGRLDFLQECRIFPVCGLSGIVFVCAVMLNLLAGIFYFGHAQRRGGTLEKVAKGGESCHFLFSAGQN